MTAAGPRAHRQPDASDGPRPADRLLERLVRARRARVRGRARRDRRDLEPEHRARGPAQGRRHWLPRIGELAAAQPVVDRDRLTWAVIEEMAVRGAARARAGVRPRGRAQGPAVDPDEPGELPEHRTDARAGAPLRGLAPNIQVKFPATRAGIQAIEQATAAGVSINATVCFTRAPGDRGRRGRRARARRRWRRVAATRAAVTPGLHDHDRPARRLDAGPGRA